MVRQDQDTEFLARIENHKQILYKVAYAYCRNSEDRADLIQDIMIELWKSFRYFDGRSQFSTWMYRVAVNVAISFYRSEGRRIRNALPIEDFASNLATADASFDVQTDNMQTLARLLDNLDELSRALVILFLDGYSYGEIAGIIGISVTNVGTRLNRIKTQLQHDFTAG